MLCVFLRETGILWALRCSAVNTKSISALWPWHMQFKPHVSR